MIPADTPRFSRFAPSAPHAAEPPAIRQPSEDYLNNQKRKGPGFVPALSRERATLRVGLDGAFLYDYMSSLGLNDLSLTA